MSRLAPLARRLAPLARRLAPLGLLLAALGAGCKRQHITVSAVPELPYPSCPGDAGPPALLAEGSLRSGSNDTREPVVERFRIEKRGCLTAVTVRQEWEMQLADIEVLYDEAGLPLRIWRRLTIPRDRRQDGHPDFKRFEFRTPELTVKHRGDTGEVDYEILRLKKKPVALIGPGRGLITMWIWRAHLAPGQKVREPALDFRGIERGEDVTLSRAPDQFVPSLKRIARVYIFYGHETVFADDHDVVIGDLAGLVPDALADTPAPPPQPTYAPLDPVGTP